MIEAGIQDMPPQETPRLFLDACYDHAGMTNISFLDACHEHAGMAGTWLTCI